MNDILITAGWILAIFGIFLFIIALIPFGKFVTRRESKFNAVREPSTEEKTAFRLMSIFGSAWAIGNLGGNATGWMIVVNIIEVWNGSATMSWWIVAIFLIFASGLPNAGQWYLMEFKPEGHQKLGANFVVMADLAINGVGFYVLTQIPLWPLNVVVMVGSVAIAWVPNFHCQKMFHQNYRTWRYLRIKRLDRIAKAIIKAEEREKKAGGQPRHAPITQPLGN